MKDKQRAVALLKAILSTQPTKQVYVSTINIAELTRTKPEK